MDYQQSVDFICNAVLFGSKKSGLDNISELLHRLGDPHKGLAFIHVAGTNGKGSVCAYIDSILRMSGLSVGLYTSPYLQRFNERIRIRGREIEDEAIARHTTHIKSVCEQMVTDGLNHPTFFELATALAMLAFAEANLDVVVLETGLGGRLDATNMVTPVLTVITSIGMDHMNVLGDTIADIAREKAGIIKPGIPTVCYPQPHDEAYAEIVAKCRDEGSPLHNVGAGRILVTGRDIAGQIFSFSYQGIELTDLRINLLGNFQCLNAATAITACILSSQILGFSLTIDTLREGLAATRWAGRMEVMSRTPFVLIDGAHNLPGVTALKQSMEELFPGQRCIIVCGILKTKDAAHMAPVLGSFASHIIITQPGSQKALETTELSHFFPKECETEIIEDLPSAVERGYELARLHNMPLLIAGSLYLAGAARTYIQEHITLE